VLERFSGRTERPALPKNQFELVCPLCGSVQVEPRLVQTTFCRKCGEHLRVDKAGHVVASAKINPVPSSIYPAMPETELTDAAHAEAKPGSERDVESREHEEAEPVLKAAGRNRRIAPPPAAPPQGGLHRLRDLGGSRQHYFKEVECFDCGNRHKVGRSARTASCPACGGPICLDDIVIDTSTSNPVRTRGDVIIRKTGNVQSAELRCRDLKLFGVLSAAIECSGEFLVQATGTIIGEVHCRRLVIDKGCDIHFMNNIFAEEVEVRGRVLGHIQCSGSVSIAATGLVQGDVKARAVSIEPGGQLDGAMNIVRAPGNPPMAPPQANALVSGAGPQTGSRPLS
jgi:cytoskeletal protein CcmA (bactofilin family)/ribosomal protein S27E